LLFASQANGTETAGTLALQENRERGKEMGDKSFWSSSSVKARVCKAVVTPTGHVVAKNYATGKLREGDIGLHVRVDLNGVEEVAPAQQVAARGVAKEMTQDFLARLGAEQEFGFRPGMVIGYFQDLHENPQSGVIKRITEHAALLQVLDDRGGVLFVQLPLGKFIIQEIPGFEGVRGLVLYCVTERLDGAGVEHVDLFKEDEDFLLQVARSSAVSCSKRAMKHLHGQGKDNLLFDIVLTADSSIALHAAECITDEDLLFQIVVRDKKDFACVGDTDTDSGRSHMSQLRGIALCVLLGKVAPHHRTPHGGGDLVHTRLFRGMPWRERAHVWYEYGQEKRDLVWDIVARATDYETVEFLIQLVFDQELLVSLLNDEDAAVSFNVAVLRQLRAAVLHSRGIHTDVSEDVILDILRFGEPRGSDSILCVIEDRELLARLLARADSARGELNLPNRIQSRLDLSSQEDEDQPE